MYKHTKISRRAKEAAAKDPKTALPGHIIAYNDVDADQHRFAIVVGQLKYSKGDSSEKVIYQCVPISTVESSSCLNLGKILDARNSYAVVYRIIEVPKTQIQRKVKRIPQKTLHTVIGKVGNHILSLVTFNY